MIPHEGFLQAIREEPLNDVPRLIYADWLEENGDPARAEFIRLQCELAALDPSDPRLLLLHKRERQLLQQHRSRWLKEVPSRFHHGSFYRGFLVPEVHLSYQNFLSWPASDFA